MGNQMSSGHIEQLQRWDRSDLKRCQADKLETRTQQAMSNFEIRKKKFPELQKLYQLDVVSSGTK